MNMHKNLNPEQLVQYLQQCKSGQAFGSLIYNNLPNAIASWIELFDEDYQRDFLLLGVLPVVGGLLFNTKFTYRNGKVYYPNWNSMMIAGPGSHKSIMAKAERLMDHFKIDSTPFHIPGDLSSAGLLKLLGSMNGCGCILETEIDSMSKAKEQKWGDHSDIYRKAFENETISKMRASDDVPLIVQSPRFSIALSGTPDQVAPLIEGHENGLFSRFFFYHYYREARWKDWQKGSTKELFDWLSEDLSYHGLALYESQVGFSYNAIFNEECEAVINTAGQCLFEKYSSDHGLIASVYRGIVTAMKIAVGLSFIRNLEDMSPNEDLLVNPRDLMVALAMVGVSLANAKENIKMSRELKLRPERRNFYRALPQKREFTTSEAIEIGKENHLQERAVYDHINYLLGAQMLHKHGKGRYSVKSE